ncbi:MAG: isoaspartyl peptidase/L-asparaginase [Bacteroidales bacterium]
MLKKTLFLILPLLVAISCTQPKSKSQEVEWAIVIHGGAGGSSGSMSEENKAQYEKHLLEAIELGSIMLAQDAAALDVVQAVVVYMEDCPLFNAGKGAVKTIEGTFELDAAIMDGSNLKAGAIAGVKDIKNPIKAARLVMDSTEHVLLIGEGASFFAQYKGLEMVENSYFSTVKREEQHIRVKESKEKEDPRGTVGCVVKDKFGNLAAATSTGGTSGKKWGRVGDVPIIGAGTYANNNTAAISGTGHGELWIRRVVAFDICALMEYKGMPLQAASQEVIFNKITPMGGFGGGIIAVDKTGNISMEFNTDMMHRAWAKSTGEYGVGVLKGEEKTFIK